jgi:putative transcriptional regulator
LTNRFKTDYATLDAMTDEEAEANALSDPDNPPMTHEQLRSAPRMPQVKIIRRAFRLTQEEFSARYHIPLGTLRDWEQGRCVPDQTARAYLKVIAATERVRLDPRVKPEDDGASGERR